MTGDLIDDEQGGFRVGRGCVDQILTIKQIGVKAQENKHRREALWQALRIYDVGGNLLSGIKNLYGC